MRVKMFIFVALQAAAIIGCQKETAGEGEHHHHDEKVATAPVSKKAGKFPTDDNLRVRMTAVMNTMKPMHEAGGKGNLSQTGAKIEATVKDIFKECKLEPAADAAIHPILSDLLKGADLFKNGKEKEGHELIHNALLRYEDLFDHPGFSHLK
ncbi:MAG: hypothetical protein HS115_09160 [Spirochaetales bacterium]|nr:hypothetical protein [Spirochaetales bacterium]